MAKKLTDKQRVFIEEYLVCWNAAQAARRAGYSEKNAPVIGAENLSKLSIRDEIEKRIHEKSMSADEVLLRLAEQARCGHAEFWKIDYRDQPYLDLEAMTEAGMMHLVKEMKRDPFTGRVTEVKFYDAQAALKLLGTHHKLFTEKTEVVGTITHEHSGTVTFEELRELPADELARRYRDALGEVAQTQRRW